MENQLARALYDNTAECSDELAFRKGEILTVMDQNVADTSGWWLCSLHGRHGMAPANRLQLLPPSAPAKGPLGHVPLHCQGDGGPQNIYQIPSIPRPSSSPAYECMDKIYKVPSAPSSASKSPCSSALRHCTDATEANKLSALGMFSCQKGEVYDVPNHVRRTSLFTASTTERMIIRKASLLPTSELERKYDRSEILRCSSPSDSYVYAVPPTPCQEPSYDIPVPAATENQHWTGNGCNTLPNPRKAEWIYDVPMSPEKPGSSPSSSPSSYGTMPSKAFGWQLCPPPNSLPAARNCSPTSSVYDIPKPGLSSHKPLNSKIPPNVLPRESIYDKLPTQGTPEDLVYAVPPQEHPSSRGIGDLHADHIPLECRGDSASPYEHARVRLQRIRKVLGPASLHDWPRSGDSLLQGEDDRGRVSHHLCVADSQRISTASSSSTSSSTSSCDSLALSSSSPEPLREVTLGQEEASRRLLELQEAVCQAVPRLMEFVSSSWRSREHLEKHLQEIRKAAEGIACSVTTFLSFSLDIKGNAQRLTDANLKTRLLKQLSIVEDSGVILEKTVSALSVAGWPLSTLSQDPGQVHAPDQLERFVMVARTVPEDVKRLVSIFNANGKLLFRAPQKDAQLTRSPDLPDSKKIDDKNELRSDTVEEDNDYVQLQTKNDFEKQQQNIEGGRKDNTPSSTPPNEEQKSLCHSSVKTQIVSEESQKPSQSEHCRLYFGALQKAIGGFVTSLRDGQPPEKFISHSKLIIMVGQRLVDTLCKEAHRRGATQSLLCKSNHLCALLKQLAVATKKAALHFPDKQALHEAQDFAKELAQRAQHFRLSLNL